MGICCSNGHNRRHGQAYFNGAHRGWAEGPRGHAVNRLRDLGVYLPLYKAALNGDWRTAAIFLGQNGVALTARITVHDETALHIAVGTGKAIEFVQNLVDQMQSEDLALFDGHRNTALSIAAEVGNIRAAEILIFNNPGLPNIPGNHGFPINKAAQFCHEGMVRYLLTVTEARVEDNPFAGEFGGRLLIDVISADFFDIALYLVRHYPGMATVEVKGLGSALLVLAKKSTAFSSGFVPIPWSRIFYPAIYIRKVRERRLKEQQAIELVRDLCNEILRLDDERVFSMLQHGVHEAAKLGVPEIIEEIVEAFPPAIWSTDERGYNMFLLALMNRRENVFNLIYQMTDFRYLITRYVDLEGNNMLHLVAKLPPPDKFTLVSGPAFLIQRELLWFEQVSEFIHPAQRVAENNKGETPKQVFREAHQQLMKDGATWVKQTGSSAAIFATLIAGVAFAGGMNVPGGFGSTNGVPLLIHRKAFIIFAIADATSLGLSVVSILTFLNIITSHYSEDAFLSVLPWTLMIGIGCLFCSIFMMLIGFGFALILLVSPGSPHNWVSIVLYASMIVILVLSLPVLFHIVRPIKAWQMFRVKKGRTLH